MSTRCQVTPSTAPNHSDDILEVWHGKPAPLYVCGYHFHMYDGPELFRLIRTAAM